MRAILMFITCIMALAFWIVSGCAGGKVYTPEEVRVAESTGPSSPEPEPQEELEVAPEAGRAFEVEAHVRARDIALARARLEEELGLARGALATQWEKPYLLLPGDVLSVQVIGQPDFSGDMPVMPDGNVNIPLLGVVRAAGLAVGQFQDVLVGELMKYLREPRATVVLRSQGPRKVTVVGPLPKAGTVDLTGQESLLEVLAQAGWTRETAGARRVLVIRRGRCAVVELEQVLGLEDPALNIRLEPRDIVVFTAHDPIFVGGEVAKAGPYTPKEPRPVTVKEALIVAGGYKETADLERALIIRRDGRREVHDVNPEIFGAVGGEALLLYPGDALYLPQSPSIGVYVFGMISRPGLRRVPKGARVSQLMAEAIPPQFGAALAATKVVRRYGGEQPIVIGVDVDALLDGDTSQDIALRDGDVVFVPETLASDVMDSIARILAPISGSIRTRTEFYQSEEAKEGVEE